MNLKEARLLQIELSKTLDFDSNPNPKDVKYIMGVDASISKDKTLMIGAAVLFSWPSLELHSISTCSMPVVFPYIPGYLSFRELPVLEKAISGIEIKPDLIIVDGQGYAHPRRFGLACHLGVETNIPSIGCAKSHLIGEYGHLELEKGSRIPITDKSEKIGYLVRTRRNVSPVWISPGHKISFEESANWIMQTVTKYRLPEPIRAAHHAASEYRSSIQEN